MKNLYSTSQPVLIQRSATSYFSEPEESLDPKLFEGTHIKKWVRNGLLHLLQDYLKEVYRHPELWAQAWLAGSGVSYQWSASREPRDLDVLIGVNYVQFRKANPEYMGLSDSEISKMLNEDFRTGLQKDTENWNGYEVTFYVNPGATDIKTINPYAAYDLTYDEWTVVPPKTGVAENPAWESAAQRDLSMASEIVMRYSKATTDLKAAPHDAARRDAEARIHAALMQGDALYQDIHEGRKLAFRSTGGGYTDFHNYRWQAGKKYGTIPALRKMSEYWTAYKAQQTQETYGIELPDTQTLIRRAATYRARR
jgi:hypothetical protein